MRLREALRILLTTALLVGFFSGFGGYLLGSSTMIEGYADLAQGYVDVLQGYPDILDTFADLEYSLGAYENASKTRNDAKKLRNKLWELRNMFETDLRSLARKYHDYGIYCMVVALLVAIGGAGWMVWRFQKEKPEEIPKPFLTFQRMPSFFRNSLM